MKTNETPQKTVNIVQQDNLLTDPGERHNNKEKSYYFDNSNICQSFGQMNIEKCIFIIFFIITYTSTILFHFKQIISNLLFYSVMITMSLDCFVMIVYLFILFKLKSENIFNKIPHLALKVNDWVIVSNTVGKCIVFALMMMDKNVAWLLLGILFLGKIVLEGYFLLISVKMFLFCPGARYLQEQSERNWSHIKYYVFCCDLEEQENPDYMKVEDIESFY